MVLIDSHVAQRDVAVQGAIADVLQRSRNVQGGKEVVGEGVVAQPGERSRKVDALAAERQGIVAYLLERLRQDEFLELRVGKHIGTDDIVLSSVFIIIRFATGHDAAVRQVQRPILRCPVLQHFDVAAVNSAFQGELIHVLQFVLVEQILQVARSHPHNFLCCHHWQTYHQKKYKQYVFHVCKGTHYFSYHKQINTFFVARSFLEKSFDKERFFFILFDIIQRIYCNFPLNLI